MGNTNKKEKKQSVKEEHVFSESPPSYNTVLEMMIDEPLEEISIDTIYQRKFKNMIHLLLRAQIPHNSKAIKKGIPIFLSCSEKSDDNFEEFCEIRKICRKYDTYEQACAKKWIYRLTYFMITNSLSPRDITELTSKWNEEYGKQVRLTFSFFKRIKIFRLWAEIIDTSFPIIV